MNSIMMDEHNDVINKRSQVDNNPIQEGKALLHFLSSLNKNLESIHHQLQTRQIDVDIYQSEPTLGIINLGDQFRGPWKLTDIIATWLANIPGNALSVENAITGPAAGATITSIVLQPGTYQIAWTVGYGSGAVAAAEQNNMQLTGLPGGSFNAIIPAVANTTVPQPTIQEITLTAVTTVAVKAIALGTATAVYEAQIVATPLVPVQTVTLKIKDRTLQLPAAQGQYQMVGLSAAILMDWKDPISLTVTPATACFLEAMGTADYRKIERLEA